MLKNVFSAVFILNALIFFFQAISKNIYAPLLPHFIERFAIDEAGAGFLVTLVFMGYALARFPSGLLASRFGCARVVFWGSTAMAMFFIFVGLAPGYFSLAALTFILGFFSGIYVTAGYTLAVTIGSRERAATSTAFFELFGILAAIISPLAVTFFVLNLSWRGLFILSGGALILVNGLFFLKRKEADACEKPKENVDSADGEPGASGPADNTPDAANPAASNTLKGFFRDIFHESRPLFTDPSIRRFLIWSTLVGGFGALSWTGVNSFLPTLLVQEKGYNYQAANQMFTLVAVAGLSTKIIVGWLGDRFGTRRVLLANLCFKSSIIIAFSLAQSHALMLILIVLWGATSLSSNTLINSHVLRNMPEKYQAAGFGLFSTAYTVIYSCGPYITGSLSRLVGLNTAVALSVFGAIIAIALLVSKKAREGSDELNPHIQ